MNTRLCNHRPGHAGPPLLPWLTIAVLSVAGCDRSPAVPATGADVTTTPAARALAVRVVPVRHGDLRRVLAYVGTVRPRREIKVSARVGGTALAHRVDEGEVVKAGQPLLSISAPEMDAKAATVRAELARARVLEANACRVARTDQRLSRAGALATARADASAAQCKGAQQAARAVAGKERELHIALAHREARAPVGGRLLRWLVEPGETVGPGRPLALLAVGDTELEVQVTDTDIASGVRVGSEVKLRVDAAAAGHRSVDARVVRVAPLAVGPLRHVAIRIALPASLQATTAGAAMDAHVLLATAVDATSVPIRAVTHDSDGNAAVFTAQPSTGLGHNAKAARHEIVLGLRAGGWVAIQPPLPSGARVITSNLPALRIGRALLTVAEPTTSATEAMR